MKPCVTILFVEVSVEVQGSPILKDNEILLFENTLPPELITLCSTFCAFAAREEKIITEMSKLL
jgi:hypothetical protein